ncbi:hypothetical protein D3C85_1164790 [compost metagenome]
MCRIDVDAEVRVFGKQRLGAFGQFVRMLGHVGGRNRQHHRLIGKRIGPNAWFARIVIGGWLNPAGVGRNGAFRVTSNLGPPRSQGSTQLFGFFRRNGGQQRTADDHADDCREQFDCVLHLVRLIYCCHQKVVFNVRDNQPRSFNVSLPLNGPSTLFSRPGVPASGLVT